MLTTRSTLTRRRLLQMGSVGVLGWSLPHLLALQAAGPGKAEAR